LVFAHPEVSVDEKNAAKMLKRKEFNKKVQAIVVDDGSFGAAMVICNYCFQCHYINPFPVITA